ncbi:hypothetical protein D3C87_1754670 [compost metagenome]
MLLVRAGRKPAGEALDQPLAGRTGRACRPAQRIKRVFALLVGFDIENDEIAVTHIVAHQRCRQAAPAEPTLDEMMLGGDVADPPDLVGENVEIATGSDA